MGENPTGNIAVDATYVYWTSFHDQTVMRAPIAGDGPAILASGQVSPDHVGVDGTNVYWIAGAGGLLWRVPIGGGTGATIKSGGSPVDGLNLVVAPPNLFLVAPDGVVEEMPSAGGNVTAVVAPGTSFDGSLAVDAANVYGSDGSTIVKAPLAGGALVTLASGQNGVARIAVDANNIYWTATNDGTVMKAPLDASGPPVALAVLQSYPTGIAVDATHVYWTNHAGAASCAGGAVMMVPIGGGTPVTLAANQPSADGIAVDATNVYWTTGGSRDAAVLNGAVLKLPLP